MTNKPLNSTFYTQIVDLLQLARQQVVRSVNQTMVLTYFEISSFTKKQRTNFCK